MSKAGYSELSQQHPVPSRHASIVKFHPAPSSSHNLLFHTRFPITPTWAVSTICQRSWATAKDNFLAVPLFEHWVSRTPRLTQSAPLSTLDGRVIGVDALYFLETFLSAHREPLLSALGGFPLALEHTIKSWLDEVRSSGTQLHFVFNGLDFGVKDNPFVLAKRGSETITEAFEVYESDRAQEAIAIFRRSGISPTHIADRDLF